MLQRKSVQRRRPQRPARHLAALDRLRRAPALAKLFAPPLEPLVELGVVDAAVEEDDEPQPRSRECAHKIGHVLPHRLELTAAEPVEVLRIDAADERHAVDDDGVGGAALGRQRVERHEERAQRQAVLDEGVEAADAHRCAAHQLLCAVCAVRACRSSYCRRVQR